jgi:hypothetical protein
VWFMTHSQSCLAKLLCPARADHWLSDFRRPLVTGVRQNFACFTATKSRDEVALVLCDSPYRDIRDVDRPGNIDDEGGNLFDGICNFFVLVVRRRSLALSPGGATVSS